MDRIWGDSNSVVVDTNINPIITECIGWHRYRCSAAWSERHTALVQYTISDNVDRNGQG